MPEQERPADLPAGHKRREAQKQVQEELGQRIDQHAEQTGIEAVDPNKLKQRDNEIARHVDYTGSIPVVGAQRGYRYARLTVSNGMSGPASANVRTMHHTAKSIGYEIVEGEDPEDIRFKGNDAATGTTMRGVGDTILARIREEDYQRQMALNQAKERRKNAIEEQFVVFGHRTLERHGMANTAHGAAGDLSVSPVHFPPVSKGPHRWAPAR